MSLAGQQQHFRPFFDARFTSHLMDLRRKSADPFSLANPQANVEDFWTTASAAAASGATDSPGSGSTAAVHAKLNSFDYQDPTSQLGLAGASESHWAAGYNSSYAAASYAAASSFAYGGSSATGATAGELSAGQQQGQDTPSAANSQLPTVLNDDENSPNDNSQTNDYTSTSDAELVKSEAAAAGGSAANTSADPLAITSNTEEQLDRSAGSAAGGGAAAVTPSVDAYAMQRYNNYDSNYAASQYVQSYYGATAGGAGYPHMTGLSAPFLYPHLYSAGHHASSVQHHGGEAGIVEDYNNPEVAARAAADGTGVPAGEQHSGQHTGYSQIGEDESQTGPIRGGYLKSEHGVWRPY